MLCLLERFKVTAGARLPAIPEEEKTALQSVIFSPKLSYVSENPTTPSWPGVLAAHLSCFQERLDILENPLFCAVSKAVFGKRRQQFAQEAKGFSFSKQLYWSSLTNAWTSPHSHSHCHKCRFPGNGGNTVTTEPSPVCRIAGNFPGLPGPATSWHYVFPGCGSKHLQNLAGPTPSHVGIFPTRDQTQVSSIAGGFFTSGATREAHIFVTWPPICPGFKNLPAMQETWVQLLGWEDPLEKEMATHSSILV